MSKNYAKRTGKIKLASGLVDYEAEGELFIWGTGTIPCYIGYIDGYDNSTGEGQLEPTYLFIKSDGITDEGNHYNKQTIDLRYRKDISVRGEK